MQRMQRTGLIESQPRDSLQKLNYQSSQDVVQLILDTLQRRRPSCVLEHVMYDIELLHTLHGQLQDQLPNPLRSIAHVLVNFTFTAGNASFAKGVIKPAPAPKSANFTQLQWYVLNEWARNHVGSPYPNAGDKHILSEQTGLTTTQVSSWFANFRKRKWHIRMVPLLICYK